jgi:hypothetical protein
MELDVTWRVIKSTGLLFTFVIEIRVNWMQQNYRLIFAVACAKSYTSEYCSDVRKKSHIFSREVSFVPQNSLQAPIYACSM